MKENEENLLNSTESEEQMNDSVPYVVSLKGRRLMAALAAAFLLGSFLTMGISNVYFNLRSKQKSVTESKLAEIESLIDEYYLFDVDEEVAANEAAAGYAETLDQYSCYRDANDYEDFKARNEGNLCGIGVTIAQYSSDSLSILYLLDDSPAIGILQEGDEIIAVEGEKVKDLGYTEAVSKIKGQEGTSVSLTIRRDEEEMSVNVERTNVVNTGIHALVIEDYGYIRISAFNSETPDAFKDVIEKLEDEGCKGLIFDLRGNGGGLLTSVAKMLDYLLPEGVLVSKTDKNGDTTVLYTSDESCIELPMAVIVNGSTASAAELFACDLQEYGAATVIGTTTYGKGVMQTTYSLSDGAALTLTTDYYNPSSGENYDGVGVVPDIIYEMTEDEKNNFEYFNTEHDPQLKTAINQLNK